MIVLLVLGVLEIALLALFGWSDALAMPLPRLLLPGGAFLCYGIAACVMTRLRASGSGRAGRADANSAAALAVVWGTGIAARLVLFPLAPELSDDVYRYLWDGHLLVHGENPYVHAPGDPALAELRTPWHGLVNHPQVPTIYPPLAQALFAAVSATGRPTVLAIKGLWLVMDLACAFVLQRAAARSGRQPGVVLLLYLWSPLLVVETAWSAHLEAAGLLAVAALLWAEAGRPAGRGRARWRTSRKGQATVVGALLAAGTLVKLAPAALLPALARRHGVRAVAVFVVACAVGYAPFAHAGLGPLTQGLRTYAEHWSANAGAFVLVEALAGGPVAGRVAVAATVLGVAVVAACRRVSTDRAMLWVFGAGILLSPTVHPWYVLWILPVAALRRSRSFLLLSGLVFLGYWGLAAYEATGVWPQPAWTRAAVWLPVWSLLAWEWTQRRRAGNRGSAELAPRPPRSSASERCPAAKRDTNGSDAQ